MFGPQVNFRVVKSGGHLTPLTVVPAPLSREENRRRGKSQGKKDKTGRDGKGRLAPALQCAILLVVKIFIQC